MGNDNHDKSSVVIVTMVRTPYFAWRSFGDHGLRAGNVMELFVPENVGLNLQATNEENIQAFVSLLRSPMLNNDENSWSEELANTPVAIS